MDWKEFLEYNEESPSCLRNKVDRLPRARAGEDCLYKLNGYYAVCRYPKNYLAHRIIYEMFHGPISEGMQVDHIDGNRENNRISNLRAVTPAVNARNMKMDKRNTTGIAGVSRQVRVRYTGKTHVYWSAYWKEGGKRLSVNFSVLEMGEEAAKEAAITCRREAIEKLNESGAGYSERHGK